MSNIIKISEGYGNKLTDSFSGFGSGKYLSGTKEFLQSNSLVAKVAFLILVVILFVMLLRLGTSLLTWVFEPSSTPKLVKGMKDARIMSVVKQDPALSSAKPVLRSNNQKDGIEFTYSVWLFIDDLEYKKGSYRHVFHKGNDSIGSDGRNQPNNAPGMYIHPNKNALVVIMNTFDKINEEIIVNDIPLNKWINVMVRVDGKNVDIYVNGTIVVRHVLSGVAKQNYGDVYVNMNGGYSGMLSSLWYYNYGLNTTEILDIVNDGPDMTMDKSMDIFPPYFSLRWYLSN